ncbi:MAG: glycosyltransferase family 39 protein, partial [Candidatus Omnitrophica bacterium]|nr:glycosyltransferase family 39 protein [Candidatus Omnitrophota bacterium]
MKWISLLLCLGLGLTFLISSIDKPLQADSIPFAKYVERSGHEEVYLWHPPAYQNTLRFVGRVFGLKDQGLRWFGIACFLLTLGLIYRLSGPLACFLYATLPVAIQGSLILDIDNTVLTVLLLLFIWYFAKFYQQLSSKRALILGGLFFLLLWT